MQNTQIIHNNTRPKPEQSRNLRYELKMKKKSKLGPSYKYGEPTVAITIRIPVSTYNNIPESKRETIVNEIIAKFQDTNNAIQSKQNR